MIINHNMNAMNAHRLMTGNTAAAGKSMEKLSSGLRINRAGDDAAGLAISEKMRGQIRGLDQASRNSQDAISLIQTAEGALNETHSILQRMRELSVQSSNDTSTDSDRKEINKEITQLKDEINRISNDTEFNTKKLLNGDVGNNAIVLDTNLKIGSAKVTDANLKADTYKVKTLAAATLGTTIKTNTTAINAAQIDVTAGNVAGLELGDYKLTLKDAAGKFDMSLTDSNGVEVAKLNAADLKNADVVLVGSNGQQFTVRQSAGATAGEMTFNLNATYTGAADTFSIKDSAGATIFTSGALATDTLKITNSDFEAGGIAFKMTTDVALSAGQSSISTTNNALTMHIGANENQTMKVDINKMNTSFLGLDKVDVSNQTGAESAITKINDAIRSVSAERSKLGAFQNRLEHTINNLGTSSENLTAAESRIRDVDMAKEMMTFSKNNILSQAAQAMLAQANQQPQGVLQLLR